MYIVLTADVTAAAASAEQTGLLVPAPAAFAAHMLSETATSAATFDIDSKVS